MSETTLNGSSQLVGRVLGTGTHRVERAYGYSASGLLRHLYAQAAPDVDPTEVQGDWYSYDHDGNIVRIQDDTNGSQRQCFAYDHRSRLDYAWTTADAGCGDWSDPDEHGDANYALDYSYDTIGNITALTSDGVTSSYSYGAGAAGPHAVTSVTSGGATTQYQYNGVGALAGFGPGGAGTTLGWDPQGQLVSHAGAGGTTSFVYDADGSRILRREPDGAGEAVTLTLEGQEIRRDADGTISGKRYYQLGGTVVAMRDGDGTAEGTVWWILGNHQGSIMTMVQRGTTTVTRQRYLPHGAPRGTATIPTDRGFLGKTEDDSTGLVHLGARYYDPRIARFISVDPLANPKNPQSLNGYTYSLNNPVTYSDPTGLLARCSGLSCGSRPSRSDTPTSTPPVAVPPSATARSAPVPGAACQCGPGQMYGPLTPSTHQAIAGEASMACIDKPASGIPWKPLVVVGVSLAAGAICGPSNAAPVIGAAVTGACAAGAGRFTAGILYGESPGDAARASANPKLLGTGAAIGAGTALVGVAAAARVGRAGPAVSAASIDEAIAGLNVGRSAGVRVVSSAGELDDLFAQLSRGGQVGQNSYPGKFVQLSDGTTVGLRATSASGGPTIDIVKPGQQPIKIHVSP